jgi:hypothetical protein
MLNALTTRGGGVAAIEKGLHTKRPLYSKLGKIPWFSEPPGSVKVHKIA